MSYGLYVALRTDVFTYQNKFASIPASFVGRWPVPMPVPLYVKPNMGNFCKLEANHCCLFVNLMQTTALFISNPSTLLGHVTGSNYFEMRPVIFRQRLGQSNEVNTSIADRTIWQSWIYVIYYYSCIIMLERDFAGKYKPEVFAQLHMHPAKTTNTIEIPSSNEPWTPRRLWSRMAFLTQTYYSPNWHSIFKSY